MIFQSQATSTRPVPRESNATGWSMRFSNHGPKPGPACDIPISGAVGPAPALLGPRYSNDTYWGRLPGVDPGIIRVFPTFLAVSPFVAATWSLARARRFLRATARCPPPAYDTESAMPIYRPSGALYSTRSAAWFAYITVVP